MKRILPLLAFVAAVLLSSCRLLAADGPQTGVTEVKSAWADAVLAAQAALERQAAGEQQTKPAAGEAKPFMSGPVDGTGPGQQVSVNVAGWRALRLVTVLEGGGGNCHIWGDARLIAKDGSVTRLGSLRPTSVEVGWGRLLVDKNWQDQPLRIGEKTFQHGIWVHADSDVCYHLGGKYERFEAWVGMDAARAKGVARFKVVSDDSPAAEQISQNRRALLLKVPGMKEFLAGPAHLQKGDGPLAVEARNGMDGEGTVPFLQMEEEWESQFLALQNDLRNRGHFARVAKETLRPEALIVETDRDPADVVLRRVAALLRKGDSPLGVETRNAVEGKGTVSFLQPFSQQLAQLQAAAAAIDVKNADARYALFADACRLRRQIMLADPLLNFRDIVFIKRHRALFDHMCDQYYGMAARPGGGLYVLENAFGPNPQVRDVLASATVAAGRLKGQKLSGGPNGLQKGDSPLGTQAAGVMEGKGTVPFLPPLSFDGMGNLHGPDLDGGTFLSPDLSFDGRSILFAYVEGKGDKRHRHHVDPTRGHWDEGRCYHVFKVNVDGTGLEQLTDGTWNDFDPCWLPNGRIAFISERRGGYLRCGRVCPNYTLFDMAADGSDITALSFHETNEWHPSVTNDGRIIYTRWDYVDRFGCTAHHPWITTLDGRDSRAVHGNFAPRNARPDMELDTRAIPGSNKFVATAAPHHGQAYGSLVLIDPQVPDDDAMAPIRRITPEVGFPESQGGGQVYGTAWPLSEDLYLCVYDAAMQDGAGKRGRQGGRNVVGDYGIYLVDSFGNRELIYRDPEIACLSPIPLRPRPAPAVAPELVKRKPETNPAARPDPNDRRAEATVSVMNVYESTKPWPEGTRIKELRVLQVLPMSVPSGGPPHDTGLRIALAGDSVVPVRHVLGTVPVEADGSAHFRVPANRELFFQALDEKGLAVQSMRSATYMQEGEQLACAGCHEPKHRVAPPKSTPLALQRGPSRLKPDVDGSNPFSYPRLVQPVLDKNCVQCHVEKAAEKAPNLGREPITRHWYASYANLVERYGFHNYGDNLRTTPGRFGAKASKLYEMLDKGHHDVKLSDEDMHRLTLWLDCSSMFYGVYEKDRGEAQLRGEIARPTLE